MSDDRPYLESSMKFKREAGDHWMVGVDGARRLGQRSAHHIIRSREDLKVDPKYTTIPNTVIDEIVIGDHVWFHLEQMDANSYWVNVAGLTINVSLTPDGKPKRVVYELGDPQHGCEYLR